MAPSPSEVWRLVLHPPRPGAANMAIDEAILEAVSIGSSPPTLRLYAWEPGCLSLGYAQAEYEVDRSRLETAGWDLVRRPTGGRALLHIDELTYAVIAPADHRHLRGGVLKSYRTLAGGIAAALIRLGLTPELQPEAPNQRALTDNPICFEVPSSYELTVQGKKLVGSAQLRRQRAVLQHGSLPLSGDITRVCGVLAFKDEPARERAADRLRARASTVGAILGRPVGWDEAANAFHHGFAEALDLRFSPGDLSPSEEHRARELAERRYSFETWTARA